jgi:hypothetical protein
VYKSTTEITPYGIGVREEVDEFLMLPTTLLDDAKEEGE